MQTIESATTGQVPTPDRTYLLYTPDVEATEADEQQTVDRIIATMRTAQRLTREKFGHSVRTGHAKAHGLLRGELQVLSDLPPWLAQGLFASPRAYPVVARLAQNPGDLDDDRRVSGPRGMSLKIFDVQGEMLQGHQGEHTQDFVLDTGKVFNAIGARTFLAQIAPIETVAPHLPQSIKGIVSGASLAANRLLGHRSAVLDFFGHPVRHPLAEPFYSQAPLRYGAYMAKLRVAPAAETIEALDRTLKGRSFQPGDYDGLRTATVAFFREHPAQFEVATQLCTDLRIMPIENANQEWPEAESPYQPVAYLVFPPQDAWSPARQAFIDEALAFCLTHSLTAHRPLGSINRARMQAYEVLSRERRQEYDRSTTEPRSIDELPE